MNKTKIILVDENKAFRNGMLMAIQEIGNVEIIADLYSSLTFLEILKTQVPDLVFIDIRMPGLNGLETARQAIKMIPGLKIIIMSMFGESQYIQDAMAAGTSGFLLKPPTLPQLTDAYNTVMSGKKYFPIPASQKI